MKALTELWLGEPLRELSIRGRALFPLGTILHMTAASSWSSVGTSRPASSPSWAMRRSSCRKLYAGEVVGCRQATSSASAGSASFSAPPGSNLRAVGKRLDAARSSRAAW